jgi:hypothetical protein
LITRIEWQLELKLLRKSKKGVHQKLSEWIGGWAGGLVSDIMLLSFGLFPEGYLDLHPNDQKHDFCHFPFAQLFWLVEEIEN